MVNPGTLPFPIQQAYDRNIISVPYGKNIYKMGASKRSLPVKSSSQLTLEVYEELEPSLVPLGYGAEGVPPQDMHSRFIDVKVEFYGTYVPVEEQVILQSQSPILEQISFGLGKTMRKTEDLLTRNMLMATATSVNAVYGSNGDTPREVVAADLSDAFTTLLGNDALNMYEGLEGENKFGTAPVPNSYLALAHTGIASTLDRITSNFIRTINYPSQVNVTPAEYGSACGFRFFLSSHGAKETAASTMGRDVFDIILNGWDSLSVVEQDEYSASFMYRPPEIVSTLGLYGEAGYKFAEKAVIHRDDCVYKLRSTSFKGV